MPGLAASAQNETVPVDLAELLTAASHAGWTTARASVEGLRAAMREHGLSEVPVRRGNPPVSVLRPVHKEQAHPSSLSAVHGLSGQPLHTDGAHHARPPAFVVLSAPTPSATPTLLWRPPADALWRDLLEGGVFKVDSGPRRFLCTAQDRDGLRFDPVCMSACDGRARRLVDEMSAAVSSAQPHQWDDCERVLIIANRVALHARAALADGDDDRLLVRVAFV